MTRVQSKVSALVETANRAPAIARMLRGWNRSFALSVDQHQIGIVAFGGQAAVVPNPPSKADVWFGLSEQTLDRLIAGRLSPLTAKLSGQLPSRGNLADILRFAAIFTACLQQRRTYAEMPMATVQGGHI